MDLDWIEHAENDAVIENAENGSFHFSEILYQASPSQLSLTFFKYDVNFIM